MSSPSGSPTELIEAWQKGDANALDLLMPLMHDELLRVARQHMRGESSTHTLQATALVNEAFIRLSDVKLPYQDRAHFLAMASRAMRRVLVDHARRKKSAKRGGSARDVTLDESVVAGPDNAAILDLDVALTRLASTDQRLAHGVELVFFGGLAYGEAAALLGMSKTAFSDDMQLAKAWLRRQMPDPQGPVAHGD